MCNECRTLAEGPSADAPGVQEGCYSINLTVQLRSTRNANHFTAALPKILPGICPRTLVHHAKMLVVVVAVVVEVVVVVAGEQRVRRSKQAIASFSLLYQHTLADPWDPNVLILPQATTTSSDTPKATQQRI
jgi:hypothetical protein